MWPVSASVRNLQFERITCERLIADYSILWEKSRIGSLLLEYSETHKTVVGKLRFNELSMRSEAHGLCGQEARSIFGALFAILGKKILIERWVVEDVSSGSFIVKPGDDIFR